MGVMAAVIAVLLFLLLRGESSKHGESGEPSETAAAPRGAGGAPVFRPATDRVPPEIRRNELGQPLNEDGRPIGPPDKLRAIRNRALEPGEVPLEPPLFDDPAERARFKKWWVDEMGRRIDVYEDLEPRDDGYPTAEETEKLLDDYYDSAEPRHPDESVDDAYARRQQWRTLWQQILDDYGGTIQTLSSRGGDPQFGDTPDPPVTPPGTIDSDGEPAPPSDVVPPGRGNEEPGGTDPMDGRQ